MTSTVPDQLVEHFRCWAGAWPPRPAAGTLDVVANPRAALPRWDGRHYPAFGVADPLWNAVLGLDPAVVAPVAAAAQKAAADGLAGEDAALGVVRALPDLLGRAGGVGRGVLRWTTSPAPLPDAGVWVPVDDPRVPDWLTPFGGEVLLALDGDRYVAGVGLKQHDPYSHELAVVTEERARGRGLARRLVAQAARRVLDEGLVPTYHHAPDNHASARVADASGFPDLGWSVLAFFPSR